MIQTFYHGSFSGDINDFLPLTHFGTYQSSIDCLNNPVKREMESASQALQGVHTDLEHHIYEVEIDFTNTKSIVTEDLISLRPAAILMGILGSKEPHLEGINDAVTEAKKLQVSEQRTHDNERPKYVKARKYVQKFLLDRNIDYVEYINDVEDRGSKSIILANTALIKKIIKME